MSEKLLVKNLVGKRVLFNVYSMDRPDGKLTEIAVLEITSSKKFVKLRYPSGQEEWKSVEMSLSIIEVLGDIKKNTTLELTK